MTKKILFKFKNIEFLWEPRDLWVGLYWDVIKETDDDYLVYSDTHLYFCLIPTLVLHVVI